MAIDTDNLSSKYRIRLVDVSNNRLRVSRISGSDQEQDLVEPTNVGGLGRVRHFQRQASTRWVQNPLPIDPACTRLHIDRCDHMAAQVFQNAACNWRCWYCYVPFDLLAGKTANSAWTTARDLVDAYEKLTDRPRILDLSGGQPELTPEWVLWTMDALEERGLLDSVYLWSDDNLSNDYFWRYLTADQRSRIAKFRNYGKVACFKGFDAESFSFNTEADADRFDLQFDFFRRYIDEGIDIYAYVTFTHPSQVSIRDRMRRFVDRLQDVDPMLPLRTVPLEILAYGPVVPRLNDARRRALEFGQYDALDAWTTEIEARFSARQRALPIVEVTWAKC